MSAVNGHRRLDGSPPPGHVAAAERLARATVVALDLCEEQGVPLSQMQKVALVEAALLEFDGLEASLASDARVDELIRSLLRPEPPPTP